MVIFHFVQKRKSGAQNIDVWSLVQCFTKMKQQNRIRLNVDLITIDLITLCGRSVQNPYLCNAFLHRFSHHRFNHNIDLITYFVGSLTSFYMHTCIDLITSRVFVTRVKQCMSLARPRTS